MSITQVKQAVLVARDVDDESQGCLLRLCGLTLFERNLRLLRLCGVKRVTVAVKRGSGFTQALAYATSQSDLEVELLEMDYRAADLHSLATIENHLDESFLQLRAEYVYDRRAIETMLSSSPNTFLVSHFPPKASDHIKSSEVAVQNNDATYFYGLSLLQRSFVARISEELDLGSDQDLSQVLASRGSQPDIHTLDLSEIPSYVVDMRRSLPVACFTVQDDEDLGVGQDILVESTQKGVLDLPAQYLHPVPENWITRRLLDTGVTPTHVTLVSNLIAFAAVGLFWRGELAVGVLMAMAVGVLDGVDGKLARLKLVYSRFGDRLDHVLDLLYEPLWYLAIGSYLSGTAEDSNLPLLIGTGIILFSFFDRLATGIFKHYTKVELFDRESVDRFFRRIGARRNTNVLILLAGVVLGEPLGAIWAVFGLTVITAVFHTLRALQLSIRMRPVR